MGNPPAIVTGAEASESYWFGTVRFVHFATAWIFTFNWVIRLYWAFVGNQWERWITFLPLRKRFWTEFIEILKLDVLMIKNYNHLSIGHNAVASLSYLVLFFCSLIMIITGFGMYEAMSDNWFANLFAWVVPLFESDMAVRNIHHILTWFFILFTVIHVYLVAYHDYVEGRGEVSSMIGGWKFIEEKYIQVLEKAKKEKQSA
jgi:Ni/Fe-hydrogenase 1 B-type cytochrome subunit